MSIDGHEFSCPHCPQCHSAHVTAISKRTLILAGIGAGLGGALMTFLILVGNKDTDRGRGISVSPIILGIFTGAMAGFSFENPDGDENAGHGYLCLDCFHYFTCFDYSEE